MVYLLLSTLLMGAIFYKVYKRYRQSFIADFDKKRVFITGTDSGFGRRLAIDLDRKGLVVYAGCYTDKGGKELAEIASSRLRVISLDITDQDSVQAALKTVQDDLPHGEGLWGLVNNAGILSGLCFDFCFLSDFAKLIDVNFFGPIRVTEAFLPLIKRSRGRIVTVTSMGSRGNFITAAYCCSKYALQPYCDGLRRSMKTFGVHTAIIEPGLFPDTGLTGLNNMVSQLEGEWQRFPEDAKKEYGQHFKDRFVESAIMNIKHSPFAKTNAANLQFVTDDIQHGLGAKHPKDRYRCGNDAIPFEILTSVMPDWILDPVARYIFSYKDVAAKV